MLTDCHVEVENEVVVKILIEDAEGNVPSNLYGVLLIYKGVI